MRIFLSGIIQGSRADLSIHRQDYREEIKAIIRRSLPEAHIICPIELHPQSLSYGDDTAQQTFLDLIRTAESADMIVAYIPEASMGSAVEMWQAYQKGIPILTISPLVHNWVIKFLSTRVFPTLADFESFVQSGGLYSLVPPPRSTTP